MEYCYMEDLFSLISDILGVLLPKKFVDWTYARPKFIRYLVISVFYAVSFTSFLLIVILIEKITGISG